MAGSFGTYAQIGTAAANATTYSDSGLAEGTAYFYRVRAVNGAGNSAYSNEANATTPSSGSGDGGGGGGGGCSIAPNRSASGAVYLLMPLLLLLGKKVGRRLMLH